MTLIDHLFLFILLVVQPIHGWLSYRRILRDIEAGNPADRPALYRSTMAGLWIALIVLLIAWTALDRELFILGFGLQLSTGFWVSLVLGFAALGYLVYAGRAISDLSAAERRETIDSLGDLKHFLPQSDRDLRHFYGVSISAGVAEEVIYRGFVLWYMTLLMPLPLAIVASAVAFGLAHSYQGVSGMLKTGAIGLVFAILFVASGTIWLLMLFHALFDILQGHQLRELFREPPDAQDNAAPDRQQPATGL